MTTYRWTTEKGAAIELTVEKVPYERPTDWGIKTGTVEQITRFAANGVEHPAQFALAPVRQPNMAREAVEFRAAGRVGYVLIPVGIANEIWAEERAAEATEAAKAEQTDRAIAEHKATERRVRRLMDEDE